MLANVSDSLVLSLEAGGSLGKLNPRSYIFIHGGGKEVYEEESVDEV